MFTSIVSVLIKTEFEMKTDLIDFSGGKIYANNIGRGESESYCFYRLRIIYEARISVKLPHLV